MKRFCFSCSISEVKCGVEIHHSTRIASNIVPCMGNRVFLCLTCYMGNVNIQPLRSINKNAFIYTFFHIQFISYKLSISSAKCLRFLNNIFSYEYILWRIRVKKGSKSFYAEFVLYENTTNIIRVFMHFMMECLNTRFFLHILLHAW